MKNNLRRRICALISSYLVFTVCYFSSWNNSNHRVIYNNNYVYGSTDPYAFYKGESIYICDEDTIDEIKDNNFDSMYIVDQRDYRDPNIKICNSKDITRLKDMVRILRMLLRYEKEYPSEWNRSLISMTIEWIAHNGGYYYGYERYRTGSVDLNNADEEVYLSLIKKP